MTNEKYIIPLIKRWKLLVICIVVLGAAAAIGSNFMTPIYQSTVLIQITFSSNNNQSDYNNLLAGDQLTQTEATLAVSNQVLSEVASHYPGLSVDQLSKEVTATPKTNTQLFEIDVQDPSPTRAASIANDVAAALIQLEGTDAQNLRIVQPAQAASKPVQPNKLLNTGIGLLAGLLLGISVALLFEQLDTRVRTSEALSQLLDWPVLASILQAEPKEEVVNPTGRNVNVEPYRILRTNISFSAIDKPLRTILVTSSVPREGKSLTTANLAIFMAKAGKTTLLIDVDLRRPTQHELFGLSADTKGFTNALLTLSSLSAPKMPTNQLPFPSTSAPLPSGSLNGIMTSSLDPFIHAVNIPNLYVMPSGPLPPNPPELLDSKVMQSFLTALDSCGVEMIIFDSPPLLGLSDASILASKVDGTLVVVDITRAKKGSLKLLKAILERSKANVLGCVVNKQRRSRDHSIYSYYYAAQEQAAENSLSISSRPTAPVTPTIAPEPNTQFQQGLPNNTVGRTPFPSIGMDRQSGSNIQGTKR